MVLFILNFLLNILKFGPSERAKFLCEKIKWYYYNKLIICYDVSIISTIDLLING